MVPISTSLLVLVAPPFVMDLRSIFRRLLMIQVTVVYIASNEVALLMMAISLVIPSLRIGMQDGRILAIRSVTLSVLSCLKLLRAWVSNLVWFYGQWRV